MSQITNTNVFQTGHVGQTDMQNIENFLLALMSTFSGASAPSVTTAGMWYFDTDGDGTFYARDDTDANWRAGLEFTSGGELVASYPVESGTRMLFFNSTARHGWTRYAGFQDGAVVTIADSGFTSGGSAKLESGLSHSHGAGTLANDNDTHNHSGPSHSHDLPIVVQTGGTTYDVLLDSSYRKAGDGTSKNGIRIYSIQSDELPDSEAEDLIHYSHNAGTGNTGDDTHNHSISGSTASAEATPPYWQESICCTKDA